MEQFIITLAKKAGNILLKNFRKDYKLLRARGLAKEVTTKYDKLVDRFIVKNLRKRFPTYNVLTEESGFINEKSEFTLVVDSLDGSKNFAIGNPFFSISIALLHSGQPIFGVVYAPFLKEIFTAREGTGTLLNGNMVHVSELEKLEECYVLSCEGGEKSNLRISKINNALYPNVKDVRKLGSGAIESAWISCERADAYITTKIEHWDITAGVILVTEAGGKVTDFNGKKWKPEKSDTVFSNRKLHNKILKIINSIEGI